MTGGIFAELDHVAAPGLCGKHVIETGKPEELALRHKGMLILFLKLFADFLNCFGRDVAKSAIDLAQDRDEGIPIRSVLFDRFPDEGGEIEFNCGCNHQTSVSSSWSLSRFDSNGIEVTNLHADAALDAGTLVNQVDLAALAGDRFDRAVAGADHTPGAAWLDLHTDQRLADFCGTALLVNMRFIFG